MLVTLPGIVTLVRPLQPANADLPMLVTPFGIVTLVSPRQPENAQSPMIVTLSGIVTLVSPLQFSNTPAPMHVTVLSPNMEGMVMSPVGDGETATYQELKISTVLSPLSRYIHV